MAGPALGVLIATGASPRAAMLTLAVGILLAGIGLYALDPPIRAAHEASIESGERVSRRTWLRPRYFGVLAVTMAATLVLSGTDVTVVAVLRENGEVGWTGLVMSLWAFYSLLGGFAYGTLHRRLSPVTLLAPMADGRADHRGVPRRRSLVAPGRSAGAVRRALRPDDHGHRRRGLADDPRVGAGRGDGVT
jgi:hypothetical protein